MPLDQAEATRVVNARWGKVAYPAPTLPIMLRLVTSAQPGSPTAAGTEVANAGGSAYAPQSATAAAGNNASAGAIATNGAITFTNMPAATVTGIETWDSAGTPRRLAYGALAASKTTALGDSLTIAAGQLTDTTT